MPSDPLRLIKYITTKQFDSRVKGTHVLSPAFRFGSMQQFFDRSNPSPVSPLISNDSSDRRFMMGISKWGGKGELISE